MVIAREIAEGTRPYIDIEVVYTPLALYLNSIFFAVSKSFNYPTLSFYNCWWYLAGADLLYLILHKKFEIHKWNSLFLSIIFFATILSFEGYYIVTEPYVVFFILSTFYVVYNSTKALAYILGGVLLSCFLFSKQYRIFAIIPFSLLIHFSKLKKINTLYFITSFLISILLFFILFSKGDVELIFNQLFASPFNKKSKKLFNISSFLSLLRVGKVFLCLVLLLAVRILKDRFRINHVMAFAICGILLYAFPILINQNQHHFISTFPFVFIAYGYTIKSTRLVTYEYLFIGVLFFLFSFLTINRLRIYAYKKEDQFKVANHAKQYFKRGESVFLMGQYRNLYLLNVYQNPLKKGLGYTWDYKRIENSKNELNNINIIFSFCFEKELFIDSLKVQPANYLCIENCYDYEKKTS